MATAQLELINPYSKYGLKRRPTYNEIIGLIDENEKLTGQLPDRTATQFKASPEGSFFDGLDHLEILKEQQNRIHERQMRELLMRQNIGNSTYSLARLRATQSENTPPQIETQSDSGSVHSVSVQAQLEERARQARERKQQTGEAHQGVLRSTLDTVMQSLFAKTPVGTPDRTRGIPEINLARSDSVEAEQDYFPDNMMTARDIPQEEETVFYSLRTANPDATEAQVQNASEVLMKYKNKTPKQMAYDFRGLNEVYMALRDNGFVLPVQLEMMLGMSNALAKEPNKQKQEQIRNQLMEAYKLVVYDKFIAEMANRPSRGSRD